MIDRGPRERCRSVPRGGVKKKKKKKKDRSRKESSIAVCHGVALKKKKKKNHDRSWTELGEVSLFPSIRYK